MLRQIGKVEDWNEFDGIIFQIRPEVLYLRRDIRYNSICTPELKECRDYAGLKI